MAHAISHAGPASLLDELGYGETEKGIVAHVASGRGLPLEQFARELMQASIHQTGHQMMAVWQGVAKVKTSLSLETPASNRDRLIGGEITFSALPERMTCRQAVAVAGMVAEWLIPAPRLASSGDEWDLFESMRSEGAVPVDDLDLANGTITWHAVRRAAKLLRRHWWIVSLSATSKRTAFLYSLTDVLPGVPFATRGRAEPVGAEGANDPAAHAPSGGAGPAPPVWNRLGLFSGRRAA
jgi:hypothetical protein